MGTFLVMKNNFRRSLRHKALFAFTFLLPVFLCFLAGFFDFGKPSIRVGILMEEKDARDTMKKDLYDILNKSEGVTYATANEKTLHTDLISGKFQIILDYRNSKVMDHFKLISNQSTAKKAAVENMFLTAFQNKNCLNLNGMTKEALTKTERNIALFMTLFIMISAIHTSGIIKDKQNGTLNRYLFSNSSKTGYLTGYFFYSIIVTFTQIIFCMLTLSLIQKGFHISLLQGVMLALIITILSGICAAVISLISKSEVQANITASAYAVIMSLLGGTFVAIQQMPKLLQMLSLASPVRWVIELMKIL